jgi:hypothetical protein
VNLTISILTAAASLAAAIGALGAWAAARRSNNSAATVADIERDRRHAEITPQFRYTGRETTGERAELALTLDGPVDLDRLDSIEVSIRDDRHDRQGSRNGVGPTDEEVAEIVWGPYRLTPGVDGADQLGRTLEPFALRRGDGTRLSLSRSLPPAWSTGGTTEWRREWAGTPVRLVLICRRDGYQPWTVPLEVDVIPLPAAAHSAPAPAQPNGVLGASQRLNI